MPWMDRIPAALSGFSGANGRSLRTRAATSGNYELHWEYLLSRKKGIGRPFHSNILAHKLCICNHYFEFFVNFFMDERQNTHTLSKKLQIVTNLRQQTTPAPPVSFT
jgi:hypothetical protein